jgi:hypothetical protein
MPVIPLLRICRQENCKFEASLQAKVGTHPVSKTKVKEGWR